MWVGPVSPRKGLHRIPQLLEGLDKTFAKIELSVYGSYTSKYEKYYNESIESIEDFGFKVFRYDNFRDEEIPYHSSKVFLQTSQLPESFSLTVLEAMAQGMLVVASNKGGIKDFGKHLENLIYFQEMETSLSQILLGLKNNPADLSQIQNNALREAGKYHYSHLAQAFMDVLSN